MKNKLIFCILSGLLATSCLSAPDIKPPEADLKLPPKWVSGVTEGEMKDAKWWSHLNDARLDALMGEMLQYNRSLQAAAARVDMAVAQARIAGASLKPQVNASGSAARRKQNFAGLAFPGQSNLSGGVDGVQTSHTSSFGASLNVSWELDLWGRLREAHSAALADVQATQTDFYGVRLSLSGQLAKVWFAAIEAGRQVNLARATVESYGLSFERIKRRYERGLRSSLDYRLAESSLAASRANLHAREQQLEIIRRQLEILSGRYPAAEIAVGGSLLPVIETVPAGIPAHVLARRPDLVAAERRLAAANTRIGEAKRNLLPKISLTASGGRSSAELSDLVRGDFSVWSLVGNIVQPLFEGGRLLAGVELAKANADQLVALYAQSVLSACGEVENALSAEHHLALQEEALHTATGQAQAARDLAEARYSRGLIDIITLLESQRNAFQSESQLLTVRRQRLDARIDLYLALGGGFDGDMIHE